MQSNVTVNAAGLFTQPNILDVPPGALTAASNVVIQRQNVVEPRRGFNLYGEPFGSASDRLKQLIYYKGRILRHFNSTLQYDTGTQDNAGIEVFDSFAGSYTEPQTGLRIKSVESNGNLYFTTSNGIQKISATGAGDFTTSAGYITPAGGVQALDLQASIVQTQGETAGFLPNDSTVAYRVVWGIKDANQNLVLGVPSQRAEVYNYFINALLLDYNTTLNAIQNVANQKDSLIYNPDYFSLLGLPANATALQLYNNLVSLTAKLDANLLFANHTGTNPDPTAYKSIPLAISSASIAAGYCTITFSSGNPEGYFLIGDNIYLSGFPTTLQSGTINGAQVITSLTASSITFATTATANSQTFTFANVSPQINLAFQASEVNNYTGSPANTFNLPGHGFSNGAPISFATYVAAGGVLPSPLIAGTTYYVGNVTSSTFQVYADSGLTALIVLNNSGTDPASGPKSYITSQNTNKITINNHGFASGAPVTFSTTGTLPSPLVAGTVYYIGNVTTNTFEVFTNSNLTTQVVFTTATGSGVNTVTYYIDCTGASFTGYDFTKIPQPTAPLESGATDADYINIQTYLQAIITTLEGELTGGSPPIISSADLAKFISPITLTQNANVSLTFTIPAQIVSAPAGYFYQVYRSAILSATGTAQLSQYTPSDEMQLVYEGVPTSAQLTANSITLIDSTSAAFAGANLYTNPSSGIGIANAYAPPPFALDINRFKNVVFYANTKTPYLLSLNLLGVIALLNEYNSGTTPKLTIANGVNTNTYSFIAGLQQETTIDTVANVSNSLDGKYFAINSASNIDKYYVWYSSASAADPAPAGLTPIKVYLGPNDSAALVAQKTVNAINSGFQYDFVAAYVSSNILTITTQNQGYTNTTVDGNGVGFTFTVTQAGQGQQESSLSVLLSSNVSPGIAINQTAQSLVEVINQNPNESVYAYYISSSSTAPGEFYLQSRNLDSPQFYLSTNNATTGAVFNPNLSPTGSITSITNYSATQALVTTSSAHGMTGGDQVVISSTNSTPNADGLYTITYVSPTSFYIPLNISVAATQGSWISANNAFAGSNQAKVNRIYYSLFQQPEAVPLGNYFDVGDSDKAILRIFPLRDTLFVFKEEGLYAITGEVAPFTLTLFDSSCLLIAPDSVSVAKNVIYGWTTQGIVSVIESGISNPPVSRPIDVSILKLGSSNYPNFSTATWGIGYESDNSYIVYTVQQTTDTIATIAYRYSTLTGSWTTFDKTDTCGIIDLIDDKLYLGAGDTNYIEQERKTFTRYDYADREIASTINPGFLSGTNLKLSSVSGLAVGDSVVQDQTLSVYTYNALLNQLDVDPGLLTSTITSISGGFNPIITTSAAHTLATSNTVIISNSNSTPSIDGTYTVTKLNATQFQIQTAFQILTPGTSGKAKYSYADTLGISAGEVLTIALQNLVNRLSLEPTLTQNYLAATYALSGTISSISQANPTIITTSAPHGMLTDRYINISGSNSTPSIDGNYYATIIDGTHFSVPMSVTQSGSTGSFRTLNSSFQDIEAVYNYIIILLNTDPGTGFKGYAQITENTPEEAIITAINTNINQITLNLALEFVSGPITIYKAINSSFTYAPVTFKDPLSLKQVAEATLMFDNKAFTNATLSFASDLMPQFIEVPFNGDGNGIFGMGTGPFGGGLFGGASNAAPFRTYVPRDVQRCRYVVVQFNHAVARENYAINGLTLSGTVQESTRAYRK